MMILKTVFREGWLRQMNKHFRNIFECYIQKHTRSHHHYYTWIYVHIYFFQRKKHTQYFLGRDLNKKCVPENVLQYEYLYIFSSFHLLVFQPSFSSLPGVNFIIVFTRSFYALRSQKRTKDSHLKLLFALLGSEGIKAVRKHVDEINPQSFPRERVRK